MQNDSSFDNDKMHLASNAGAPKSVESKDGCYFHVLQYVTHVRGNQNINGRMRDIAGHSSYMVLAATKGGCLLSDSVKHVCPSTLNVEWTKL